jgi:hypothetical protein
MGQKYRFWIAFTARFSRIIKMSEITRRKQKYEKS